MRIAPSLIVASCWLTAGCGGPEATPPAEAPAPVSTPAPAPAPAAPLASPETTAAAEPSPPPADSDEADATRTVTYVVAPGGALKISVSGVKFTVSAAPVKIAAGWGVKVSVAASA